MNDLLRISLEAAVPLWQERLRAISWEVLQERAREAADMIASKGDVLQFGGGKKGEAAQAFNRCAEAITILSFLPGGVTFAGLHFEAAHVNLPRSA